MPRYKATSPSLIERRMSKAAAIRMRVEDYLLRAVGTTLTSDDVAMILRAVDSYADAFREAETGRH